MFFNKAKSLQNPVVGNQCVRSQDKDATVYTVSAIKDGLCMLSFYKEGNQTHLGWTPISGLYIPNHAQIMLNKLVQRIYK